MMASLCAGRTRLSRTRREGALAVEFALVVPIVFVLFFGAFEFCRVAMIRHTVDNAVYEGGRRGIIPGGSAQDVSREAQRVLSTIGITGANINVVPARITPTTEEVTVTVTVPLDENTFLPARHFAGRTVTRSLSMQRER